MTHPNLAEIVEFQPFQSFPQRSIPCLVRLSYLILASTSVSVLPPRIVLVPNERLDEEWRVPST